MFLFFQGCATTPSAGNFPYPTITIHDASYFSLMQMCERVGLKWDYDPLSKEIVLKKEAREMRLLIGSSLFFDGAARHELSAPIEIKDSVIYAPIDLRDYIEPPACRLPEKPLSRAGVYLRSVNTVIVDAGHGGKDPGAIGRYGLKEKSVVLDVAQKVQKELERCGLKVYLTRSSDEFIPLSSRPEFGNRKKADLFVSIHANANRSRWIEGFEVYYLTESVDDDTRALAAAENQSLEVDSQNLSSKALALKAILWDMIFTENRKESVALANFISKIVARKLGMQLLGVKGAPFAVLKGAQMPAVLVEVGYISNKEGEKKLRDPLYRQKMAQAIAEGIMGFKDYCERR
jgi:N-acetylmuramoyl-L-alanine amidase